jgi:hypothetical protein
MSDRCHQTPPCQHMRDRPGDFREPLSARTTTLWGIVMILLCGWVALRMGILDLSNTVVIDGQRVDVLNTFGTVDHPFHSTRGSTLLESLKDGDILRWIGHHQGGYPVEFYPLGIAWLDVAIWAVSLGAIPILAAHKVAIILVFLLPAWSFWLLARGDRLHPSVAVLAAAVHFAVPGHWLNGGYEELVGWGLVTNVAGGSLALLATVSLARFVLNREFGMGVLATLAATGGAVTNPRSLFAVVMAAIGIAIVGLVVHPDSSFRARLIDVALRTGGVGGIAVLLSAPVVIALFRYNSLYFFLHYEFYEPLSEYWTASSTAVTTAVVVLSMAGCLAVLLPLPDIRLTVSRGVAAAAILYVALTMWVATASVVPPLVEQLEAPRLMPYQRQLMIWFGALGIAVVVRYAVRALGAWSRDLLPAAVMGGLAIFMLVAHVRPLGFVPAEQVGLREISTTGNVDHATMKMATEHAESIRPDGTTMFVIGNRDDWWHQQLWAPAYSDARFYYDDWMWYWHDDHAGPYDPANGYWMPNPTDALTGSYLDENGIGVVMVTDMGVPYGVPPRESARSNPRLTFSETFGEWDVYTVNDPTSLVTNGDSLPAEISIGNQEISARFEEGGGTVIVRQNWFPRWKATANGEAVDIVRRDDGYMELAVPPGAVEVRLEYAVTGLDWVGRIASAGGAIALGGAIWRGPGLLRRRDDPSPSGSRGTVVNEGNA